MEIFGLLFSIPAAFVASSIYSSLVARVLTRWPRFRPVFFNLSIMVLVGLAIEIILLASLGAVRSRELLGLSFSVVHFVLFLLGMPSLATVLVIVGRGRWLSKWQVVAPLCAVFAFGLVLLQYSVSESLHGIDGISGPIGGGG